MSNPLRCGKCRRVIDERTGAALHPEAVEACAGFTCPECSAKANSATLAAWKRLTADERRGAATEEERK